MSMNDNPYLPLLEGQQAFFQSRATLPLAFRRQQLRALRTLLRQHESDLCDALHADFGKGAFDTYATELGPLYAEISWQLRHLPCNARTRRIPCNLANLPATFRLMREPLGCVLVIGAWNYPLHLSLMPAIDAMAAGCTAIIKPSELTQHTSKLVASLINNAFRSDYLHVVEGGAEETQCLASLHWDKIFFTGSPRVGRIIYQKAAENTVPVTLEMGGKSPVIVTPSANLALAARRIAWGKCLNAGQTCVAPDYLLAHRSVKDELLTLLAHEMSQQHYLPGGEACTSIVNEKHYNRLLALLAPYRERNGLIVCGGKGDMHARCLSPTVVDGVQWHHPIMQEEIFGPLLPVLAYEDLSDALAHIAAGERPLSAYLFSRNVHEQRLFLHTLPFGGGCINDVVMHLSNPAAPFGGVGGSGMGCYHGEQGFLCFSHQKTIMQKPRWEFPLKFPPHSARKLNIIKRILR